MSAYAAQIMNDWISKLHSEESGSDLAPKVHCFLTDRRQLYGLSAADVRKRLMAGIPYKGVWRERGIYVWYWPPVIGRAAWPLYVGKVYGATRNFRLRTAEHLAYAVSGRDSLYCPVRSQKRKQLESLHRAGQSVVADHAQSMVTQFSNMRILLLPIPKEEAPHLAGAAESLLLCAANRLNTSRFSGASVGHGCEARWGMNTLAKVCSVEWSQGLIDEFAEALDNWMALDTPVAFE